MTTINPIVFGSCTARSSYANTVTETPRTDIFPKMELDSNDEPVLLSSKSKDNNTTTCNFLSLTLGK